MHIWIPQLKALTCAENANHSLHNIQTLRGARTRDARNFARYLDETLERWGDEAEVHYGPHTWPVWGNAEVVDVPRVPARHLQVHPRPGAAAGQQGLHARSRPPRSSSCPRSSAASGSTAATTAPCTTTSAPCYTKELGMWDGDPVSLHPHPPVESGEALRRPDRRRQRSSPRAGGRSTTADYRWAVEILHKLVFADPDNQAARDLQADAYEQMGYQAEGPQWRGIFLTAAQGTARGRAAGRGSPRPARTRSWRCRSTSCSTSPPSTSTARQPQQPTSRSTSTSPTSTRPGRCGSAAASSTPAGAPQPTPLTVSGPKAALVGALLIPANADELAAAGQLTLQGDRSAMAKLAAMYDEFDPNFNMVTP